MPSVYTIEGASPARRKPATKKQAAHRNRFRKAAKRCKGKSLKSYRACMRRELKKKK